MRRLCNLWFLSSLIIHIAAAFLFRPQPQSLKCSGEYVSRQEKLQRCERTRPSTYPSRPSTQECSFTIGASSAETEPYEIESSSSSKQEIPVPARYPKTPQIRRQKPRHNRKPKYYWQDPANVEAELRALWAWANVTTASSHGKQHELEPPAIPNEALLNYWKRHDIRAAIATYGGRETLSEVLGGAPIIPGKWSRAAQFPQVQQVLLHDTNLSQSNPPLSPQQLKQRVQFRKVQGSLHNNDENYGTEKAGNQLRHCHKRRPRGYWSSRRMVIKELCKFLEERKRDENVPSVWMPRSRDLSHAGREDLAMAIRRFGGHERICRESGLIQFKEWNYFEGMHELLLKLRAYMDSCNEGILEIDGDCKYKTFPVVYRIKERGYDRLYTLIQYYGGRKFLAARLGMEYTRKGASNNEEALAEADMNWGAFDLEFGIELYDFIRKQHLQRKPPLRRPEIAIPSRKLLLEHGPEGVQMDTKIQEYGGYENVARRLGLAYNFRPLHQGDQHET